MGDSEPSPEATALELLEEQDLCTLATASPDAVPEAATVRYMCDETFNVFINSGDTYRKYENMIQNPRVAVVVNGEYKNLQLEGAATEVPQDKADHIINKYIEKYGDSEYLTNDESVFFRIDTVWARLLVDGRFPPEYEMILGDGDTDPHNGNSE